MDFTSIVTNIFVGSIDLGSLASSSLLDLMEYGKWILVDSNRSFRMIATGLVYQLKLVTIGLDFKGPSLCILGIDLKFGKFEGNIA
jgi:hypothetical protein